MMTSVKVDTKKTVDPFKEWSADKNKNAWCVYGFDKGSKKEITLIKRADDTPDRNDKQALLDFFEYIKKRGEADKAGAIGFVKLHAYGYTNVIRVTYNNDNFPPMTKMLLANAIKAAEAAFDTVQLGVACNGVDDL